MMQNDSNEVIEIDNAGLKAALEQLCETRDELIKAINAITIVSVDDLYFGSPKHYKDALDDLSVVIKLFKYRLKIASEGHRTTDN